jgi:hypothetical protein
MALYDSVHIPAGSIVRVGDSVGSMTALGEIEGESSIAVSYDRQQVVSSTGTTVKDFVKNMTATASFNLMQLYLPNVQKLMDGVATVAYVAGSLVSGAEQVIASGWAANQLVRLEGQNGSGAAPTINSVSGSSSGAGAADDDYTLVKGTDGLWYIALRTDGTATFATSEAVTIDYDYTPAASRSLKMGSKSAELTPKIVEFEKTIGGKIFRVRLWSAVNVNGITIAFPPSDNDSVATIPMELQGSIDTSKADGEQLLDIYDEIGVDM